MKIRIKVLGIMLLLSAFMGLTFNAAAAEPGAASEPKEPMGNLLVILSTDDLPIADASIRIAGVASERGHQVTLLLRVKAIQLALKDTDYKIGHTTYQEKLAGFMKTGARVFVGGGCMKLQNIPKEKLIPGVVVGTPDTVMGMIFDKNTRIICQ